MMLSLEVRNIITNVSKKRQNFGITEITFFEMAARPFPYKGVLLIWVNLPRVFSVFVLKIVLSLNRFILNFEWVMVQLFV